MRGSIDEGKVKVQFGKRRAGLLSPLSSAADGEGGQYVDEPGFWPWGWKGWTRPPIRCCRKVDSVGNGEWKGCGRGWDTVL